MNEKVTEWYDRLTWPKETRWNVMASLNYLYLKVKRCSVCTLLGSVQAEQGPYAKKRANGASTRVTRLIPKSVTCNIVEYGGKSPEEEPGGGAWASQSNWGVPPLYNSWACKWPFGKEPNLSVCDERADIEAFIKPFRGYNQKLCFVICSSY